MSRYNLECFATMMPNTPTDTGFQAIVDAVRPGSLRYPGGTMSNVWDLKTGLYVPPCALPFLNSDVAVNSVSDHVFYRVCCVNGVLSPFVRLFKTWPTVNMFGMCSLLLP